MRKNLLLLATVLFATMGILKAQSPVATFSEDFEDGTLGVMTTINADGDNYDWKNSSTLAAQGDGHNGSVHYAYSESWYSVRPPLYPDNYLVTPLVAVDETSVFTFFVCSDWYAYVGEHYGVAISTTGNTDAADFTTIAEWDLTDKGTRDDDQGPWHEHNIDLSQYAGQNVYIAIRHFGCSNIYRIDVDDISVTSEGGGCLPPTNLRYTGQDDYLFHIEWDAVESANSYNVYRSLTGSDYELICAVEGLNSYSGDVNEFTTAYFQVTAVYSDCESEPATTAEGENFIIVALEDGVDENEAMASLYPNPSSDAFNINCQGMTRVTVFGLRGETIVDVHTYSDSYTITDLNTGVYFVRIETATGSMTQKIVKL